MGIKEGDKYLLLGSSPYDVEIVQSLTPDRLVLGFEEEIQRQKKRQRPAKGKRELNPFIERYEVLQDVKYPPPSQAMDLLHKLASDPGIINVMKKYNWRVGTLKEMYPEGKVGISEVCVLGLNQNKGQAISLRIRTDDLKGFRNYNSIKDVMLHELTHNEFSEHDGKFWALFRRLQKEAVALDWTKQGGHTLGTSSTYERVIEEEEESGGRLGGQTVLDSRQAMIRAAEERQLQEKQLRREKEAKTQTKVHEKVPKEKPVQVKRKQQKRPEVKEDKREKKESKEEIEQMDLVSPRDTPPVNTTEWNCSACTYLNPPSRPTCEMCGTSSPLPMPSTPEPLSKELESLQSESDSHRQKILKAIQTIRSHTTKEEFEQSMRTFHLILANILEHPAEEKYKKISLTGKTFQNRIGKHFGGKELMNSVGFQEEKESLVWKRNDPGLLWLAKSLASET